MTLALRIYPFLSKSRESRAAAGIPGVGHTECPTCLLHHAYVVALAEEVKQIVVEVGHRYAVVYVMRYCRKRVVAWAVEKCCRCLGLRERPVTYRSAVVATLYFAVATPGIAAGLFACEAVDVVFECALTASGAYSGQPSEFVAVMHGCGLLA